MQASSVDLENTSRQLEELVDRAVASGEVLLARRGETVAKIVPLRSSRSGPRKPGSARGQVHMAEDFDATPDDFRDYL